MKRKSNMPKHKLELAPGATSNTDQHHQDLAHQPPTKRLRVPLNFSIESIMQPASQQQQALSAYQFLGSPDLIGGSPLGLSAAATSYHQNRQNNNNNNNNNNNSNSNNHHHQQHLNHQQQAKSSLVGLNVSRSPSPASHSDSSSSRSGTSSHTKRRYQSRDIKPPAHNHMTLNERESLASPLSSSPSTSALSSRNSSRVSSPISPGCHQEGNSNLSLNTLNHHHHHQQQQQQQHHHHHRAHLNSNQNQKHRPLSSQSPSFTNMNQHQTSSRHHHQAGASSSSAPNATTSNPGSTGHLNQVECVLDNKDMWDKFHSLNTEMIITKTGRRMFPVLKVQFHNLDPTARYAVSMDIVPVDNKRYRYAYHKSCWQVAGKADPSAEPRLYPHPDSPFNGDLLSRQVISFEKVKLTNNEMDKSGHIILNSMHKYQPRVHLIELKSTLPPQQSPLQQLPSLNGTHSTSKMSSPGGGPSRFNQQQTQQQQQQQQKPQPQLDIEGYRTFVFPETVFTAVTAYQNQLITKMKIDKNPFAKGFRDSSRLNDLDRNDPFDYMSSLGPAAAAAAAAACAAGRFPGGPSGGPSGLPLGSLEAAAAAAGLPPPPGSHQGQMDQAYSQLLVSAATANSPWYSAAAANPFGGMGAACSTAQAAQLQATQLWLAAAFSSAFQNGGSGQPQSLPPPNNSNGPALLAPPGGPTPSHTDSPLGSTPGALHQECRGDSRSSG